MGRSLAVLLFTLALNFGVNGQERKRSKPAVPSTPTVAANLRDNGGWVRFTSEVGRFTVLMPEIPGDKPHVVQSEHGSYTTQFFVVRDTKSVFFIGWVDYEPSFNFSPQHELEANRDNFLSGKNARLLSSQTTRVDGYLAMEFTAENEDTIFKSRIYLVGRRPYQIFIGSPKGQDDTISANRFFNSFKVRLD